MLPQPNSTPNHGCQLFDIHFGSRSLLAPNKYRRKFRSLFVGAFRNSPIYFQFYSAWWHSKFNPTLRPAFSQNFLTAIPNSGAGIGHQIANWIAGYWYSGLFKLGFAHTPFGNPDWDSFLGFGEIEESAPHLLSTHQYHPVRLPLFDEFDPSQVALIRRLIQSYNSKRVLFILEHDQSFHDQFPIGPIIKRKFAQSTFKLIDDNPYPPGQYNIAIHIRRGDIQQDEKSTNHNLAMRWLTNQYFERIIHQALPNINTTKPIHIYLFSQGSKDDFPTFTPNFTVHYCLDMDPRLSFLHMVRADLLITSKSSFSYKPALLSNGIKICPRNFWHGYPDSPDWILADEDGRIDAQALRILQHASDANPSDFYQY